MIQTYPYITEGNYTVSDSNKIEISASKFNLKLQQDNVDFTEDCEDDTDFTYDSGLVEFLTSLFRQTDKRPTDCDFYASYEVDENGSWGNGTLTGTLGGNASVHDGYLDLLDGYEEFPIDNFSNVANSGCIQIRMSFNYTGNAPSVQYIIQTSPNTTNRVYIAHNTNLIQCYITNASGIIIYNMSFVWTPNAASIYNFAVNWTNSHAYFFINGQLQDSDTGSLSMSAPSLFRLGGGASTAFKIYDIAVFSTLQHSSNYSPDWSDFYEKAYLKSVCVFPEMEHIGDGSIKLFNSLSITYTGEIGILLEIGRSGNKLYWTGSEWGISSDSYTEYTNLSDFNSHCDTLPVVGEKYGQFTIVFFDSNTQGSVSELTANLNVDIGYSTDNPYFYPNSGFKTDGLMNWVETLDTLEGNDAVKRLIKLNSDYYYFDGEWITTDTIDYTKAMTVSEILAQKESLLTEGNGKTFLPITFLHSGDGTITPYLDTDVITYNFSGIAPTIKEIFIYGNLRDTLEGIDDDIIYYRETWTHGLKTIIVEEYEEYTVLTDGYIEISLRYEEGYKPSYIEMKIKNKYIKFNFPSDELLESGDYIEIGNLEIAVIQNINL
jgi:hypothetical protein